MSGDQLDVSVIVLSYDRVDLLERTLITALAQSVPAGFTYDVIVVDNHPDLLAMPLVTRLARSAAVPLSYLSDAVRNISIVRNKGIAAARGRYVAFVDDDEAPDPDWVAALAACLDRSGADAAFGPKYPVFATGQPPAWDPQGWRYTCDFKLPADSEIHMFGRLRKRGKGLGSGNSAYRVATCFNTPEPFSIAYGNANGEDTHLLFRLSLAGKRFVWCPGAVVREFIEPERMRAAYMITRMKRGSQHYATCRIGTSDRKAAMRIKVALLGLAQIAVHSALYLISGEFLKPLRFDHRIGIAKGLGKLTYRAPIGFIDEKQAAE